MESAAVLPGVHSGANKQEGSKVYEASECEEKWQHRKLQQVGPTHQPTLAYEATREFDPHKRALVGGVRRGGAHDRMNRQKIRQESACCTILAMLNPIPEFEVQGRYRGGGE